MTDEQLRELIDAKVKEVLAQQNVSQKATPRLFAETHKKWFRDESGASYNCKMNELFHNSVVTYAIWDRVRPIVTNIMGKKMVRQIPPEQKDFANKIADRICQVIYDSRKEWVEMEKEKKK